MIEGLYLIKKTRLNDGSFISLIEAYFCRYTGIIHCLKLKCVIHFRIRLVIMNRFKVFRLNRECR